jgi:hypothetical protein
LNADGQCNVPAPNSHFVGVSGGGYHSLGLKSNGIVVAWGRNAERQCNIPAPNADFVAIAAGVFHSLGLKTTGTVVGWGANEYGQRTVADPNADFGAIAAGEHHSLGLKPAVLTGIVERGRGVVRGAPSLSVVSVSPNPFNPSVEVLFELNGSAQVSMEIYDVSGRRVRTMSLGLLGVGRHRAWWNGKDARGNDVSSGMYFIRLGSAGAESRPVKAVLLR